MGSSLKKTAFAIRNWKQRKKNRLVGECSLFDGGYVDFRSTKHCSQANLLQWTLKTRSKTDNYYMLVTRLFPGNTLFHLLLAQVSKRIFDANVPNTLIPKDVPSKAISQMDHRAIGREGKKIRR